jgi:hypothetical protein
MKFDYYFYILSALIFFSFIFISLAPKKKIKDKWNNYYLKFHKPAIIVGIILLFIPNFYMTKKFFRWHIQNTCVEKGLTLLDPTMNLQYFDGHDTIFKSTSNDSVLHIYKLLESDMLGFYKNTDVFLNKIEKKEVVEVYKFGSFHRQSSSHYKITLLDKNSNYETMNKAEFDSVMANWGIRRYKYYYENYNKN